MIFGRAPKTNFYNCLFFIGSTGIAFIYLHLNMYFLKLPTALIWTTVSCFKGNQNVVLKMKPVFSKVEFLTIRDDRQHTISHTPCFFCWMGANTACNFGFVCFTVQPTRSKALVKRERSRYSLHREVRSLCNVRSSAALWQIYIWFSHKYVSPWTDFRPSCMVQWLLHEATKLSAIRVTSSLSM